MVNYYKVFISEHNIIQRSTVSDLPLRRTLNLLAVRVKATGLIFSVSGSFICSLSCRLGSLTSCKIQ